MEENKEKSKKEDFKLDLEEMAKVGLHLGRRTSIINPKMKPYIFGVRNAVHIIDLDKTKAELEKALKFIQKIILENKILLLVGTKVQNRGLVKEVGEACSLPYVDFRWLGGTFTNFPTIKKRVDYFLSKTEQKEKGELAKYTKKEQLEIAKELKNLDTKFGGIKKMANLPDAVLILDPKKDDTAVKEARKRKIKIIALLNTNNDPSGIDYPIPANNDSVGAIKYITEKVKETVLEAKSQILPLREIPRSGTNPDDQPNPNNK